MRSASDSAPRHGSRDRAELVRITERDAGAVTGRDLRSAKSLLEPRVVADGGEVVVSARVLAEPRKQFDGPPEVGEGVVAGVARERCEARVVVMQARVIRHALEGAADRFER